ncbi:NAD-specific glutamate dehydrogenase [compost metagenome]
MQAGETRGVLGGLPLGVVEVGRHGDHRADQFATQGGFGTLAQHAQDVGGDFHRALRPLHGVDERHLRVATDEAVRQLLAELFDVGQAATHQPLDRDDAVEGIAGGGGDGRMPHLDVIGQVADRRRQDDPPRRIGQRRGAAAAHGSDQGIGGTEVDSHRQAALVRLGTEPRFGNLQ